MKRYDPLREKRGIALFKAVTRPYQRDKMPMILKSKECCVRAHVFISGRVQGVDFRRHTQRKAEALGLTGWVRDLLNGSVEAIFEGEAQAVQQAVEGCHTGPPLARVECIEVSYEKPTGDFNRFLVTW